MTAGVTVVRRTALLALSAGAVLPRAARAQGAAVQLFKVIGPRDEITIGLTAAELDRLGSGPAVDRIAQALVANGQVTAWRYAVGRAPEGGTRYAAIGRVAVLRSESLRVESYAAALPVAPPPAE